MKKTYWTRMVFTDQYKYEVIISIKPFKLNIKIETYGHTLEEVKDKIKLLMEMGEIDKYVLKKLKEIDYTAEGDGDYILSFKYNRIGKYEDMTIERN